MYWYFGWSFILSKETSDPSSSPEKEEESHYSDEGSPFVDAEEQEADIRRNILDAALVHVPEFGWSSEAIEAGAQAIGLSAMAEGMFVRGSGDLVLHFQEDCNLKLADYLLEQSGVTKDSDKSVKGKVWVLWKMLSVSQINPNDKVID